LSIEWHIQERWWSPCSNFVQGEGYVSHSFSSTGGHPRFTFHFWVLKKTHFRDLATPLLLLMTIFYLSLHKESLSKFCARRGYVSTHFLQLEINWGLPFTSESWRKTKFRDLATPLLF
jgi:hypothetical protein